MSVPRHDWFKSFKTSQLLHINGQNGLGTRKKDHKQDKTSNQRLRMSEVDWPYLSYALPGPFLIHDLSWLRYCLSTPNRATDYTIGIFYEQWIIVGDHCLFFFYWPLYCLSFFDLRLLVTTLVSSNYFWDSHYRYSIAVRSRDRMVVGLMLTDVVGSTLAQGEVCNIMW